MTSNPLRAALRRLSFVATLVLAAIVVAPHGVAQARRAPPTPTPTPSPTPEPTPTPTPTPMPFGARMERLSAQLTAIAHEAPGTLGVAVVDPMAEVHIAVRGDRAFPLASTYKLAIALAAYRGAADHKLSLDDAVPIVQTDLGRGYSPIAEAYPHAGISLSYWQLVRAMLVDSDNVASDLVLRGVGGPAGVQAMLSGAGLGGFNIRKSELDMHADAAAGRNFVRGGDNAGTPDAVAELLVGVANLKYVPLEESSEFLLLLSQAHVNDTRLAAGFPPHTPFAHKSGTSDVIAGLADATNDAGLLTLPDGHRIAVVALLTASSADAATRDAVLAKVGRAVYEAFVPPA